MTDISKEAERLKKQRDYNRRLADHQATVIDKLNANITTQSARIDELEAMVGRWKANSQNATGTIRVIRAMIGEIFGPTASIESEDATLLRGPEPKHDGEAILEALQRVHTALTDGAETQVAAERKRCADIARKESEKAQEQVTEIMSDPTLGRAAGDIWTGRMVAAQTITSEIMKDPADPDQADKPIASP